MEILVMYLIITQKSMLFYEELKKIILERKHLKTGNHFVIIIINNYKFNHNNLNKTDYII